MDSMRQFGASFLVETGKLLDEFGALLLENEAGKTLTAGDVDRLFRVAHTVKGSAGMMGLAALAALTHALEDLFVLLKREGAPGGAEAGKLFDLLFEALDAMRGALEDFARDEGEHRDFADLIARLKDFREPGASETVLRVTLTADCAMENVRAYLIVSTLRGLCPALDYYPQGLDSDENASARVRREGLYLRFPASCAEAVRAALAKEIYVERVQAASAFPHDPTRAEEAPRETLPAKDVRAKAASAFPHDPTRAEETPREALSAKDSPAKAASALPHDPTRAEELPRETLSAKDSRAETASALPHDPTRAEELPRETLSAKDSHAEVASAFPHDPKRAEEAEAARALPAAESYVSVHLDKLQELQTLMNEWMLAQNRFLREAGLNPDAPEAVRLDRSAEALREALVALRMAPVAGLFQRLHRAVREAGRRLGREIEFVAEGGQIEIDKGIADALAESLLHIVRNAAVHGIESPAERLAAGKPLMGKITVSARNAGTSVVLSVADDGRGISAEKVWAAARENGLAVEKAPETAEELLRLLVRPGLTTSARADELSGRGMGLDVVRSVAEKLRGSLSLETEAGRGSTFRLRVPQSLSVMDYVCLGAGGSVFLLPALDIYALTRPRPEDAFGEPDGRRFLRYQGYALPLIDLGTFYGLSGETEGGVVAILEGEERALAIRAETLLGPRRAASRPLPALFEALGLRKKGISGLTILDDGSLGLILDAEGLLTL